MCPARFPICNEANQAWFQASSALQNGLLQDGCGTVFYFQDYLLPQLLSGALAGRPSWVYYPDGLKKLKAHDESSQVSYLETLRVYLDNNLSVTKQRRRSICTARPFWIASPTSRSCSAATSRTRISA